MPELTAEELKKKEEEEASSQQKEKVTSATSTSQQEDLSTKTDELTDAQKLRIFEISQKTVREQGARLTATERELAELKSKAEEKEAPTTEESAKGFYADPVGTMKKAMAEMVAPLNEFKDRFESNTEYARIKRGLMVNPAYAQHLNNPQVTAIVDEIISEGTRAGIQVSEDNVIAALKHTIGSVAVGDIVLETVKTENKEEGGKEVKEGKRESPFIPPYLAPSSPPHKKRGEEKQYRELTENEARLARERGQSKEEYLDWLEVDPADVIDSKIGMKEEKK